MHQPMILGPATGREAKEQRPGGIMKEEVKVHELATEVAVLGNRMKVSENRMAQVERDIRALRSHMDRNQAILGALVVLVPVALHFMG